MNYIHFVLYADDINLLQRKNIKLLIAKLSAEFSYLDDWLLGKRLSINVEKSNSSFSLPKKNSDNSKIF